MTRDVDLTGLAVELRRSYDWTQRNWRRLVRDEGMPAPFVGGEVHGRPRWSLQRLDAWKHGDHALPPEAARSTADHAQPHNAGIPPANDAIDPPAPRGRVEQLLAAAGG